MKLSVRWLDNVSFIAQTESNHAIVMMPFAAPWIVAHSIDGKPPERYGNRHPDFVPHVQGGRPRDAASEHRVARKIRRALRSLAC